MLLNRKLLGEFALRWNPARVGGYDLQLPRALVRKGFNRMEIVAITPGDGRRPAGGASPATTFSIWYVRVRPVLKQTL